MLFTFKFTTYYNDKQETCTHVIIFDNLSGTPLMIAAGISVKSDKDIHCKALGQKYAVRNALRNNVPDKTQRALIWNNFFSRSKATAKLKGVDNAN